MDRIRVQERLKTGFPSRIYKDGMSTLKKLGIKQNAHFIVELLEKPAENYPPSQMLFYLRKRKVKERAYEEYRIRLVEIPGDYPTLPKLKEICAKIYDLDAEKITLAKYLPYSFTWQKIVPPSSKSKKNKKKAPDDLRSPPCLLKEGGSVFRGVDIIAVRDDNEEGADNDDFMSKEDEEARKNYEATKLFIRGERKKSKKKEQGVVINTDF